MADSPTSSKTNSLIHRPTTTRGGWHAAIFIIFVEFGERFAYQGMASNLLIYLTHVMNVSDTKAVKDVNTWVGVSALFPLLGAFIADSYLGRFKTILISSLIYLLGTILLSISAINHHKMMFFLAIYVASIGDGGHKPCVQTFAADQFDEDTMEEREKKSSFFNWWYMGVVAGSTIPVFLIPYLQQNGWWAMGFGLLAGVLGIALAVFLLGIKRYRKEGPYGSPFTRLAQVFVAATRKWRVNDTEMNHQEPPHIHSQKFISLLHTHEYRFLDKAMMIDEVDATSKTIDPWRLCSVTQVEEVKLILRLIPIWLSCIIFTVVQAQGHTYFVKQADTLDRSIGANFLVPPAVIQGLVGIIILIAVPIYDKVFMPLARKFTGHPTGITVLQRIGIGQFLSILTMVVAALVEAKRVGVAIDHDLLDNPKVMVPMRIWWLLPQYIITGVSDAFAIVGLQELLYDQMPEGMRSMGAALYISIIGVGNFASIAIIDIVVGITLRVGKPWLGNNINKAHLDYFYWVLALLSALSFCAYLWLAKIYEYKKVDVVETNNQLSLSEYNHNNYRV
ncbi:hypothetical protein Lal_00029247 [Lupinus albus]|uniref:Putative proton-dependent oligopeptide transporter family, major facilitator superfamily n=1 Tax=Lupinus albus TaxID=3870 RepID=A0A6A4NZE3_LUPAL|nr:putative proton-dependent oligopeptide transporter family, major facilitator superfamily [Lupinus albus]KAF1885358.1 hypothetical protein Lal_00029247 [Lupinus albus]